MLGRAGRTQRRKGGGKGRSGGQPFEAFDNPAFIQQRGKLVLQIECAPQQISLRQIARVGEQPGSLGRNARQSDRPQRPLHHISQGLQQRQPPAPSRELGDLAKRGIAAEQLVPAEPRQHHLQAKPGCSMADQIGVQAVDGGLVHRSKKIVQQRLELAAADSNGRMLAAEDAAASSASGASSISVPAYSSNASVTVRSLELCSAASAATTFESIPADRNTPTGTSATRWWRTESSSRPRNSSRSSRPRGRSEICLLHFGERPGRTWRRASAHALQMTGRKRANAGPPGERLRHVPPEIEAGKRRRISPAIDRRYPRQRSRLRCKPENSVALRNVKRLDPIGVAGQPQLALVPIPERKCIHAAQLAKPGLSPVSNGIDKHLGVAVGEEHAAELFEFVTQRTVIVDFAIEGDRPAAGRIRHRLGPVRPGIDDGKAPVAKRHPPIGGRPEALAVRASAPLQLVQTRNDGRVGSASLRAKLNAPAIPHISKKSGT